MLFDYVNLTYSADGEDSKTLKVDVSGKTSSITLENLSSNKEYTLSFQAHHKTGMLSPFYTCPEKFICKIAVESISITESSIPEEITVGTKFEPIVEFSPENASIRDIKWTFSNPDILQEENGTITAIKAGSVTLTAESVDNNEAKDSIEISVKLSAPQNVKAESAGSAIRITWDTVPGAEGYKVLKSTENGSYTEITSNVSGTEYSDSNIISGASYSYRVKAFSSAAEGVESISTPAIEVPGNSITILLPSNPVRDFELEFEDNEKLVLLASEESITVRAIANDNILTYTWMMNGEIIKAEATADDGGTFVIITGETDGIKHGTSSLNTLTLKVKTKSGVFCGNKDFGYIEVLDEGVTLTSHIENQTYRVSSTTDSNGTERTIQLTADVFPSNATLKNIRYVSSNPSIASVGEYTGLLTFHKGAITDTDHTVTITASSTYGEKTASVTFDVYDVLFADAKDLVNAVNEAIGKRFKTMNSENYFNGDWWWNDQETKTIDGITFKTSYSDLNIFEQKPGNIKFENFIDDTNKFTITTGNISIWAKQITSYVTDGPLEIVGHGNSEDTIYLTLAGNQGTAKIVFNDINVIENNNGNYEVTFDNKVLGYNGEDLSRTVDHITEGITRLL